MKNIDYTIKVEKRAEQIAEVVAKNVTSYGDILINLYALAGVLASGIGSTKRVYGEVEGKGIILVLIELLAKHGYTLQLVEVSNVD